METDLTEGVTPVASDPNAPISGPTVDPNAPASPDTAPAVPADGIDPPAQVPPPEAPVDASVGAPEVDVPTEPPADAAPASDGPILKADVSHGALALLLAEGGLVTNEILDQIEARESVGDIKFLVAFCKQLLGSQA